MLNSILANEYPQLRNRVFKAAFSCRFTKQDAEDLLHDIVVNILEDKIEFDNWGSLITTMLGKARSRRSREERRFD